MSRSDSVIVSITRSLCIDELGFVVMPDAAAELLFQVIAGRAEQAAVNMASIGCAHGGTQFLDFQFRIGCYWKDSMPEELCPICEGSGQHVFEREDGTRFAKPCECRVARRSERMIKQAHIPERYAHCMLGEYVTKFAGANRSLAAALVQAQSFVKAYPFGTGGNGLLLTGSIGVGKTHLAVGILRELIAERGAKGLFVDYRELLKELQNSYSRNVDATELGILQPVFDAEVLVLDELGASKPSEWVGDTIGTILNGRYNRKLTTIVTTNYANLPPGGALKDAAKAAIREDTLGDRIGERIRSRLQEMCVVIPMEGDDFRQTVKRASFS